MRNDERHRELGLTDDEYAMIAEVLGREPNDLELAMYSVMWSEHCSYKSSRIHLSRLPSEGPQVIVGPGENAGVIDVGDGVAVAIRIESHNHPSFIEPYQGAATGVGGILRDIFTMGARPIALMDPLFVGELDDPHARYLLDGIVRGVAGYGNSVGVPTVGGQISFDETYRANPLVNVFCAGILPIDRLVLARASGIGNRAVLLGSRTGRDGIGGVSVLASSEFSGEAGTKRPSVQVGDPYEEKRLIEACLELLDRSLVVGIQDLGGAGLSCAASEIAARGGLGIDFAVDAVPRREPGMSPIEVMTSESQERMLAIVAPTDLDEVLAVCARWEVEATVVGTVTAPDADGVGRLRVLDESGRVLAEVPAASLADDAPRYERPLAAPARPVRARPPGLDAEEAAAALLAMLVDPAFIYRQYDHELFLNTVLGPGVADATLLRLHEPGTPDPLVARAIALSSDANPGWCALDPRAGTAWTVVESALNVACTGARPLALVNCLNFGSPEHPEVMWQLSESVDGMAEASRALGVPVVGGNVSLYNASDGRDIDPTPTVAVLGLLSALERRPPSIGWDAGDLLVLLGDEPDRLDGSRLLRSRGTRTGELAPVDLARAGALVGLVAGLVAPESGAHAPGLVHGIHAVKDGGLALCLAECAIAAGIGAAIEGPGDLAAVFGELPLRVVVATADPDAVVAAARRAGVATRVLGRAGGTSLELPGLAPLPVDALGGAFNDRPAAYYRAGLSPV